MYLSGCYVALDCNDAWASTSKICILKQHIFIKTLSDVSDAAILIDSEVLVRISMIKHEFRQVHNAVLILSKMLDVCWRRVKVWMWRKVCVLLDAKRIFLVFTKVWSVWKRKTQISRSRRRMNTYSHGRYLQKECREWWYQWSLSHRAGLGANLSKVFFGDGPNIQFDSINHNINEQFGKAFSSRCQPEGYTSFHGKAWSNSRATCYLFGCYVGPAPGDTFWFLHSIYL